jgi:hypothetical protein
MSEFLNATDYEVRSSEYTISGVTHQVSSVINGIKNIEVLS